MAEDEIIKHTKAAYKAWANPHKSWKHKVKEVLLEVAIIVFAVSLSIWFHNWSEDLKDRREEKDFLAGLRKDLQSDTAEMNGDRAAYTDVINGFRYFRRISHGAALNSDSLRKYDYVLFNTTELIPNISRFEALKGSGKLDIIENKELLNHILDLYQEDIPHVNFVNQSFNQAKASTVSSYITNHVVLNDNDSIINLHEMLKQPQLKVYLLTGEGAAQNIQAYDACIAKSVQIMQEIDEALK
ncbi:MAG TPA: hypothetical protein VHB48_13355 [Chitinophagaceae bacterium]|jgi:hypothetical protein|nr:hypothetical protein [Chitinophagaceae bacterium]